MKIIIDNSYSPVIRKKKCKFKGCITILNQINAIDQLFCSNHQQRVTLILNTGKIHKDYSYYEKIVKKYHKILKEQHKTKKFYKGGIFENSS